MEVLFVSHKFPPAIGGMEKQSYELITGMDQYCKVHRIVYEGNGSVLGFFFSLRKRIVRICKENPGISVIHFSDGLLTAFCSWHKGYGHLKRTATLHGLDVVFPSKIYHKYILPRFNRLDKLIAVSTATANRAMALGIDPDRLTVIPNGVDTQLTREAEHPEIAKVLEGFNIHYQGQCIFVAMGRPVRRKGFSWFIENVVPLLRGDFLLLLIGPFEREPTKNERFLSVLPKGFSEKLMLFLGFPSDRARIRELLPDPKVASSVKHLGRLPSEQIKVILTSANGFVMPNIHVEGDMEGFGLVCLEAAMSGLPVFAADIDGIPDAVRHEKNGYLLPAAKPQAWADRLNEAIANPEQDKKQGKAFRQYTIENYNWDKMVKTYYQLFLSL